MKYAKLCRNIARKPKNARRAGFDAIEIYAANGYLIHQLLSPTVNQTQDGHGGSIEKRARFLREIAEKLAQVMPLDRIGVRISPFAAYNNVRGPNLVETYRYVAASVNRDALPKSVTNCR
jgi:N-ethylmaleimide reductase